MIENELQKIWQSAGPKEQLIINKTRLLLELEHSMEDFEKAIKNRDRRETLVAWALMPVFALAGYFIPHPLSKIAILLLIPWCGLVIYKLKEVKKYKPADPVLDTKTFLGLQRDYLLKEKSLLSSVFYWYILPPTLLLILFFIGANIPMPQLAIHISIVFLVNGYIYHLNRKAAKNDFEPVINKIDASLLAMEKEI